MTVTVGKKLLAMSLIGAFLTVAVAVTAWMGISMVSGATSKMMKGEAQIAQHSARVRANTIALRRFEKDIFINIKDAKKVDEYVKELSGQQDYLATRMDALKAISVLPQDKERVAQMTADFKAYVAGMSEIISKVKARQIKTAEDGNKAVDEYKDVIHRLETNAEEFATEGNKRMGDIEHALDGKAANAMWMMSSLAALAVVLGLVLSMLIGRNITSPLSGTVEVLRAVAARDLTQRLDIERRCCVIGGDADFLERGAHAGDGLVQRCFHLAQLILASRQLSAASEQLSSGAREQASSLEETAASLEDFARTYPQDGTRMRTS